MPAQPRDPQAQPRRAARTPGGSGSSQDRSLPSHPCARGGPRARHPQGAGRARRGPPAVHPRPQPVPGRMGKGPAHHRGRGSEVLPAHARDQDHERGMGELLAQAHPGVARSRTGPAPGIHRAPQPGRAPDSRPDQPLPSRLQNLGGHPSPPHQSDGRRKSSATARRPRAATPRFSKCARPNATARFCAAS